MSHPTVLVTGGSGGIGSEVCRQLLTVGFGVIVLDRVAPSVAGCEFVPVDLSIPQVAELAAATILRGGRELYAVVNCVGCYESKTLEDFSWEEYGRYMQINLRAPLEVILAWLGHRNRNMHGVLVNIGSAGSLTASCNLAYAASKGAIESATRSLARSAAAHNVFVYCISPSVVNTAMSAGMSHERRQDHIEHTILKRAIPPSEIADIVCYLITSRPGCLAGAVLDASGGLAPR